MTAQDLTISVDQNCRTIKKAEKSAAKRLSLGRGRVVNPE